MKYGNINNRLKAVFVDYLAITGMGIAASAAFSGLENPPDSLRLLIFLFVFIFYDPTLTSFWGGTLGHQLIGLRVRRKTDEQKNISYPVAFVRFIFKSLLGSISLLTLNSNPKKMAIHDFVVGSVVINK